MPEINPIKYEPTLDAIALTPELEVIMVQAIRHLSEQVSPVKLTVRWQFWTRQIYDAGRRSRNEEIEALQTKLIELTTPRPIVPSPLTDEERKELDALPEDDANE